MKKLRTMLLAAVLVLSMVMLAGCGGKKEKDKFIGTWETTLEMASYLNDAVSGGDQEMAKYVNIDSFALKMNFTFKDDGTYAISVDPDTLTSAMENFKGTFSQGMTSYLEEMMKSQGVEMSVDEALDTLYGMTMDELVEQSMGDFDMESMSEDMAAEGNWKVDDGKLFLSDGTDYEVDEEIYDTYEFDGENLKLLESVGTDDEDLAGFYPLTLTKVS